MLSAMPHASCRVLVPRRYGERSPSPDQRLFVERKVHREKHSGEASYKERAPLAQRHVADYSREQRGGGRGKETARKEGETARRAGQAGAGWYWE
jgi:SPX domain protein involved in polyphosphate accumulation